MSPVTAITVRLPRPWAVGRVTMAQVLRPVADGDVRAAMHAFGLTRRETWFAKTVLTERTQWWLWRTHQKRFAGDFALVDMSSPDPARRSAWVIDLKMGRPVKLGGGGAGVQLKNAGLAVRELVASGVVTDPSRIRLATGDGRRLAEWL